MGWNEARVTLIPPGWRPVVEESSRGRTADGTNVIIVDVERQENPTTENLCLESVIDWLQKRGFVLRDERWQRLTWEDVEVDLFLKEGELADITLTFTLSQNAPSRWAAWIKLVRELCESWNLRLIDADHRTTVGADQLLRLLARTVAWRDFEENFGWPPVTLTHN